MLEPLERESDVLRRAVTLLQERLPPEWTASPSYEQRDAEPGVVQLVEMKAPDGSSVRLLFEGKRALVRRDLPGVLAQLRALQASVAAPAVPVVVARYLSASARSWLEDNDVSFIDATGNMRLVSTAPPMYLRDRGADRDPWRGPGRPRGTLRGEPAARVVRALADCRGPLSARQVIARARSSTGATYRVLEFLEEEGLVTRGAHGVVESVRWREMLDRWSQDYGFARTNAVTPYLAPRGLPALMTALTSLEGGHAYAVTGSLAAQVWAPYAPPRLATFYADDVLAFVESLGLRPVETGANVLLAAPKYEVALERSVEVEGRAYAAPSQVAVDLLSGPGRSPSEGRALLDWMEENEDAWRS